MSTTQEEIEANAPRIREIVERWRSAGIFEVLTQEEAIDVWGIMHEITDTNDDLRTLVFMDGMLRRECQKGTRCAVCGRYEDERCTYDC